MKDDLAAWNHIAATGSAIAPPYAWNSCRPDRQPGCNICGAHLLATLDDLSLDAANGSLQLMGLYAATITKGTASDGDAILAIMSRLSNSGAACNDIAELIFNATLRMITTEEDVLQNLSTNQK
jgi:hypothetical protein